MRIYSDVDALMSACASSPSGDHVALGLCVLDPVAWPTAQCPASNGYPMLDFDTNGNRYYKVVSKAVVTSPTGTVLTDLSSLVGSYRGLRPDPYTNALYVGDGTSATQQWRAAAAIR